MIIVTCNRCSCRFNSRAEGRKIKDNDFCSKCYKKISTDPNPSTPNNYGFVKESDK